MITGATSGIGYELAKKYASANHDLVIVSANKANLLATEKMLRENYRVEIRSFCQNLAQKNAPEQLYRKTKEAGIEVEILINNAGIGLTGPTDKIDLELDEKMLMLNVVNLVKVCKLFIGDMYQRGAGKILNIASTGAYQPGPYTASYFASKSFVLNYTKAIRYEARGKGVQVCVLSPGTTKTNFFSRQSKRTPIKAADPVRVALMAYLQLERNRGELIFGWTNKLMILAPEKIKMAVIAKIKREQ